MRRIDLRNPNHIEGLREKGLVWLILHDMFCKDLLHGGLQYRWNKLRKHSWRSLANMQKTYVSLRLSPAVGHSLSSPCKIARLQSLINRASARSRLYRRQILQENMRWKAFTEIYTMDSFAPVSTLNFSQIDQIHANTRN